MMVVDNKPMEKKYVLHKENAILVVLIEKYIGSSGV
jgi:hypothetical protein